MKTKKQISLYIEMSTVIMTYITGVKDAKTKPQTNKLPETELIRRRQVQHYTTSMHLDEI